MPQEHASYRVALQGHRFVKGDLTTDVDEIGIRIVLQDELNDAGVALQSGVADHGCFVGFVLLV